MASKTSQICNFYKYEQCNFGDKCHKRHPQEIVVMKSVIYNPATSATPCPAGTPWPSRGANSLSTVAMTTITRPRALLHS